MELSLDGLASIGCHEHVPDTALGARWDALAGALEQYRDVLDGRVTDSSVPLPLVTRDWAGTLLSLTEAELVELEISGCEATPPARFPESLRSLHALSAELCTLPALGGVAPPTRKLRRLETPRKRAQVEALARLARPLLEAATRVVEVGAGHGHLAREVALSNDRPVVALERDPEITAKSRTLGDDDRLTFREVDVLREGLGLAEGDCALGLHACGELGDALIAGVAERADSVLLVGCCLQKLRADVRVPLNAGRAQSAHVSFPKSLLGLSNFTPREQGVEATRSENVAAHERRLALHALLSAAAGPIRFGSEMDGLNRRAAHGSLEAMLACATAKRGLAMPSSDAIEDAKRAARALHDHIRRLSLPRILLGRVLEIFIFIDRALFLESAGFEVTIGTAFPKEISARNLTILGRRRAPGRPVTTA